jgi:cell wall-associated NlpC family hydrolase
VKKPLLGLAVAVLLLPAGLTLGTAFLATATIAAAAPCGPAGPARTVTGHRLDPEQLANAQLIIATTAARALPAQAAVIAVATALQESNLRNLDHGDRDSLGLFQQRTSWAPASTRTDPVASTGLFLDALTRVPDWQQLPVTVASDRVQRSAHPDAVARWEPLATALVADHHDAFTAHAVSGPAALARPALCPGQGGDDTTNTATATLAAAGLAPITAAAAAQAVAFALAQLGKPYVWGATGPGSYDCSGLTMRAWGAAGVAIPRTTYLQVDAGTPVPSAALAAPGDLLFTVGRGTPTRPGHVGMYIGTIDGTPALVQAPRTGKTVEITPLSDWASSIVAIRRPHTPAAG